MLCQVGKGRKSAAQSHTTNAVLLHRPQVQGRTANASLVKDANERELLSGHLCSQHSNLHLQCTYFRGTSVQETAGSLATEAGSQQGSSLHLGSWYWQHKSFADVSSASTMRLVSITNTGCHAQLSTGQTPERREMLSEQAHHLSYIRC